MAAASFLKPFFHRRSARFPGLAALFVIALVQGCMQPENTPRPENTEDPALNNLGVALSVLPSQFTEVQIAGGIYRPTAFAIAPDGRFFITEQSGALRIVKNGSLLPTPFLTVSTTTYGERGLLGVALDPGFPAQPYVYVYYTVPSPLYNRISRFTVSSSNPDVAQPGSETLVLALNPLTSQGHNGGALHFGPDGKLYIGVGENETPNNSQSMNNLLGKLLRINKDGTIPTDNPFYNTAVGVNRAIWALGLRNPFTFAIHPGTGRIHINDVGKDGYEEIDEGVAGANYGWPITEGPTSDSRFRAPISGYPHPQGCAITGGDFYAPARATFPAEYVNDYFFADQCADFIRRMDWPSGAVTTFGTGFRYVVDMKTGNDGSLYLLTYDSGTLLRISYTGSTAPVITTHPSNRTVSVGGSATFIVSASGASPLAYQWQRNGTDIPGATSTSYTLSHAQSTDHGARFRARVANAAGSVTSNEATLTVTVNRPPTATITVPVVGTTYRGNQTLFCSGTGTDPENGILPASAFTWTVDFHHNVHYHPFIPPTSGVTSGSVTIPNRGETSHDVWYRITLTVRDAGGLTHTVTRDVLPVKATVTLATIPAGLQVKVDGTPFAAPVSSTVVAGVIRSLEAPSPQTLNGATYTFVSWSDGGAATHEIPAPASNTTYTATFQAQPPPPPPDPIYQAENATLSGPVFGNVNTGFNGSGYATYTDRYTQYVEWTVNVAAAGDYSLDFRYAHGGVYNRWMEIRANGAIVKSSLMFKPTGSFNTWSVLGQPAALPAGNVRIRATTVGIDYSMTENMHMDQLQVR